MAVLNLNFPTFNILLDLPQHQLHAGDGVLLNYENIFFFNLNITEPYRRIVAKLIALAFLLDNEATVLLH